MAWTYRYVCQECGKIAESEAVEAWCAGCGAVMERERIIWHGSVRPNNTDPYFHVGLGKWVRHPGDVRNEVSRLEGETGMKIVELGTEDPAKLVQKKSNDDIVAESAGEWVAAVKEADRA